MTRQEARRIALGSIISLIDVNFYDDSDLWAEADNLPDHDYQKVREAMLQILNGLRGRLERMEKA